MKWAKYEFWLLGRGGGDGGSRTDCWHIKDPITLLVAAMEHNLVAWWVDLNPK